MTDNRLINLIHTYKALDEKWQAMNVEERRQLVDSVLTIAEGVIQAVDVLAAMQTIKPDAEKGTAICGICLKRRKVISRRLNPATAEYTSLCRKCSRRPKK